MSRRLLVLHLLLVLATWAAPLRATEDERPRSVIFMIADGFGPASLTLARHAAGAPLHLDGILTGTVATHPAKGHITDSAASGTAMASGIKTLNGMLGVDPAGRPVGTLIEAATARGMATGIVTTTELTHATPAAFSAHVNSRDDDQEIAIQQLTKGIGVLFGGGRQSFLPTAAGGTRTDGRDLVDAAQRLGYAVALDRAGFDALDGLPALGLFESGHMSYEIDRDESVEPSLAEMVAKALALLNGAPEGFLLVVEGGRIDHAGHQNDPAAHLRDVFAYDEAVGVALAYATARDDVLVVSTADHETGGLTLGVSPDGRPVSDYDASGVLLAATASIEAMVRRLRGGDDPVAIVEETSGVKALQPGQAERLRTAAAVEDGGRAYAVAVSAIRSEHAGVGWSTFGHTAVDVLLFAFGPGADRLRGHLDNTDLAQRLAELLGLDLDAVTRSLRDT